MAAPATAGDDYLPQVGAWKTTALTVPAAPAPFTKQFARFSVIKRETPKGRDHYLVKLLATQFVETCATAPTADTDADEYVPVYLYYTRLKPKKTKDGLVWKYDRTSTESVHGSERKVHATMVLSRKGGAKLSVTVARLPGCSGSLKATLKPSG